MTGTPMASKFSTWSVPGHTFRIEYSPIVLDQIRMTAVEGYHRVPHGGVETGGILFGSRLKGGVRIKEWRPIDCEYARGPSFLLSEKDEAALAATLKQWRGEADLASLEPVGWYRAHTRSEVLLSEADVAFFGKFFPQPWQVGLIVRPASFAPTRAGFFFREAEGQLRTESSHHEFVMAPLAASTPRPVPPVEPEPEAPPIPAEPQPEPVPIEVRAEPEPVRDPAPVVVLPRPSVPPRRVDFKANRKLYAAGGLVALVLAGIWFLKPSHKALALSATDAGGQLQIAWDRAARPLSRATGGLIEINDHGILTQVKLTPADLRSGSVFYERQTGDVTVHMIVELPDSPAVSEMTHFLRASQLPVQSAPPVQTARQPEAKPARIETQPQGPVPAPVQTKPAGTPPPPPVAAVRTITPFRAPEIVKRQTTAAPSIALPAIDNLAGSSTAAPPPSVLGSVPIPAAPAAPAAPLRPKPAGPTSGRIIWTGRLPKNGRLVLEGNHASAGAVSGALPAGPVRVSAYPGDLTAGGITLFTSDPRYNKPLTEAAGAENGWNATTFTMDSKRAGSIKILEQPTQQNGYKLVLQSDTPKLPVVVLDWRAAQ